MILCHYEPQCQQHGLLLGWHALWVAFTVKPFTTTCTRTVEASLSIATILRTSVLPVNSIPSVLLLLSVLDVAPGVSAWPLASTRTGKEPDTEGLLVEARIF